MTEEQLVSGLNGKYSWDKTTDEEHEASKGTSTNNDMAETPFSTLSFALDHTGRLDPMHAAAMAIAAFNNIFYRSEVEVEKREDKREKLPNGAFISLSDEMKDSLLELSQNLIRVHSDRCCRDANALDKRLATLSDTKKLDLERVGRSSEELL